MTILGWVMIVPKLIPHLGGFKEVHEALATSSQITKLPLASIPTKAYSNLSNEWE